MTHSSELLRSLPETQGISSTGIEAFLDAIEQQSLEIHSMMLLRHSHVVAEGWWKPYTAERPHMLFSLSKSFTSTAVGFAVTEGLLHVEDKVISFFPDQSPQNPSEYLSTMSIHDLLCMGTGHDKDTTGALREQPDGDWVKAFLEQPVVHPPGIHFLYNSGASYMLSAIVQKVSGQTLLEYLTPRLFEPLGIKQPTWETCPNGINTGGWGLSLRTEDIAKFGQLYLHKGNWDGRQLIPEAWVKKATAKQISNGTDPNVDWQQGYGYQFWRCRHGLYRGDGAFGQFCIIFPEHDAVLAITSGENDLGSIMENAWTHILPALQNETLPENKAASGQLQQRLKQLELKIKNHQALSPYMEKMNGHSYCSTDDKGQISRITFHFDEPIHYVDVKDNDEYRISFRMEQWTPSATPFRYNNQDHLYSVFATWEQPETLLLTLQLIETPFRLNCSFTFHEQQMELKHSNITIGKNAVLEESFVYDFTLQ